MLDFAHRILRRTGKRIRLTADASTETGQTLASEEYADTPTKMAQTNGIGVGIVREQTPVDTSVVPPGRVISTSMMRHGTKAQ